MKESLSFIPGGLVHCSQMGNHVGLGNVKKLLPNSGFFDPIAFSQCFRILEMAFKANLGKNTEETRKYNQRPGCLQLHVAPAP